MKKKTAKSKNETKEYENLLNNHLQNHQVLILRLQQELKQYKENDTSSNRVISSDIVKWLQEAIKEFKNIPESKIQQTICCSFLEYSEKGEKAEYFYILLSGICSVSIQIPIHLQSSDYMHLTEVNKLEPMSIFGELALIHPNGIRSSEVTAKTDCILIAIPKLIYCQNLRMDIMNQLDTLWGLIKNISYLKHWNERDIVNIIYKLPTRKFSLNQVVYSQGEPPISGIFFVLKGEFEVRRQLEVDILTEKERSAISDIRPDLAGQKKQMFVQVALLSNGNSFGEEEVILNKNRENNVICISEGSEVYYIDKQEFEKRILWDQETRKCLHTLIQQRQMWGHQKLQEFQQAMEISKHILISRRLSSDMQSIVEQEQHFQQFENSSQSRKSLQSKGQIINEQFFDVDFSKYFSFPQQWIKISTYFQYFSQPKRIKHKQSNYYENGTYQKNNHLHQNNELQRERGFSQLKLNQDESAMSLQEAITIDILKDQNKIMGFQQDEEDINIKGKNSINNNVQIRKEYSFNDQVTQLLAQNTINTQRFEAINKKDVNKFSNQTASQFANQVSKKHKAIPDLDEDYKQLKGETIAKYIDRIKRVSYFKRVKDEKKQILSQELNSLFRKYLIGSQEQMSKTPEKNLQYQQKPVQRFVDFNFVRTQYKNQKLEEILQQKQQTFQEKSPKTPILSYEQQQSIPPIIDLPKECQQINNQLVSSSVDKSLVKHESLNQKNDNSQSKCIFKSSQSDQQYVVVSLLQESLVKKEEEQVNIQREMPIEKNDHPKSGSKNRNKEYKLYLINSPKMIQYFSNQNGNNPTQTSHSSELYNQNSQGNTISKNALQFCTPQKQFRSTFNEGFSGNIFNRDDSNQNNVNSHSPNNSEIDYDFKGIKQNSQIFSISQNSSQIVFPHIRNYSQITLNSSQQQKLDKEQSILNKIRVDTSCILQTKATSFFNRPSFRSESIKNKFSQSDEVEFDFSDKDQLIHTTELRTSQSEQNSPVLNPYPSPLQNSGLQRKGSQNNNIQISSNASSQSNMFCSQIFNNQEQLNNRELNQYNQASNLKPSRYLIKSNGVVQSKSPERKNQINNYKLNFFKYKNSRNNSQQKQELQQKPSDQIKSFKHDFVVWDEQKKNFNNNRRLISKSNIVGNEKNNIEFLQKLLIVKRNQYLN